MHGVLHQRRRSSAKNSSLNHFWIKYPCQQCDVKAGNLGKNTFYIFFFTLKITFQAKKRHQSISVELLLASLLILLRQGYDHLEGLYAFFISHVFLVLRLSFLCCKVQIILHFKSRLHIQYIVHGFCSFIH